MMRALCRVGLHSWKRQPDELGGCGMGLEWFEVWTCRRCMSQFDQVRRQYSERRRRGDGGMPLKTIDLRPRCEEAK